MRGRVQRGKLWAGVALVGLATITADGFLPHTDDGCEVEVHCLACRLSVGQAATTAAVVIVTAPATRVERVSINIPRAPLPPDVHAANTRGPPLG